ncbi:MAG: hypothetical protein OJF62_003562 [Pseudolabrys sp.]|jgi:transcription elongation factor Elf1|nr:hypothetical protein [Pseudolabrys sp.]
MHLQCRNSHATLSTVVTGLARCPRCNDLMVAPDTSEFVDRGEIRHRWNCEACGLVFETAFCAGTVAE